MIFTPRELKLIERLREEEKYSRSFPLKSRWLALAVGVITALLCVHHGYAFNALLQRPAHPLTSSDAWELIRFWNLCAGNFLLSLYCFARAIRYWHGDTARTLLLRLLDEREKDMKKDAPGRI